MRHRGPISLALTLLLVVGHAQPAAACSVGPFEPRDITQLLVLGRARSLEIGPRTPTGFREAIVTLAVMHVYRGVALSEVTFVDHGSLSIEPDVRTGREITTFAGGSGACGTIDEYPVGKYVLIALARGEDSRWHANRLFGAIYSDAPDYTAYRWLLERHAVPVPFLVTGLLREAPHASAFAP